MTALLDINILLDVLLLRTPWLGDSQAVWDASDQGTFQAHISATTLPTIFYIVRKLSGQAKATASVDICMAAFEVSPVDRAILELARSYKGSDFEDNIQMACAAVAGLDAIVTRDTKGMGHTPVPVFSPPLWLAQLGP